MGCEITFVWCILSVFSKHKIVAVVSHSCVWYGNVVGLCCDLIFNRVGIFLLLLAKEIIGWGKVENKKQKKDTTSHRECTEVFSPSLNWSLYWKNKPLEKMGIFILDQTNIPPDAASCLQQYQMLQKKGQETLLWTVMGYEKRRCSG